MNFFKSKFWKIYLENKLEKSSSITSIAVVSFDVIFISIFSHNFFFFQESWKWSFSFPPRECDYSDHGSMRKRPGLIFFSFLYFFVLLLQIFWKSYFNLHFFFSLLKKKSICWIQNIFLSKTIFVVFIYYTIICLFFLTFYTGCLQSYKLNIF